MKNKPMLIFVNKQVLRSQDGRMIFVSKLQQAPVMPFEMAIESIRSLSKLEDVVYTEPMMANILGNELTSSALPRKIRLLKKHGLIEAIEGGFTLTGLATKIIKPESDDERCTVIANAFLNMPIIHTMWEDFVGVILPTQERLTARIGKKYPVTKNSHRDWANYFYDGLKYSNLITEVEPGSWQVLSKPTVTLKINVSEDVRIQDTQWGLLTQRKLSDNRRAIIAIPDELTPEDIVIMQSILRGAEASLEGLKKHGQ